MAVLDKGLKQRIVGALVLVALAVIFLPMLFSREDELRQVVVDAPPMPPAPAIPEVALAPVEVPQPIAQEQVPPVEPLEVPEVAEVPSEPAPTTTAAAVEPVKPVAPERLDASSLPVSWSVQLASLSSRSGAEDLQKKLRSQGYNAYVRTFEGMNRVFVGPLVERAEADRLRDQLNRQQKLNGFVVRFQPENG